ncbi:MAG: retropepsin-like aspartic protease family protein [Geminicoccaceae bacterium]
MIWVVAAAVVLLGLLAVLNGFFPGVLGQEDNQMSLTHNVLLLALLGSSLILGYRGRMGAALKHALAWIAIVLLLVLGYSYRDDVLSIIGRVGGELVPGKPTVTASGDVELRAASNGHFQADARINGANVRLLVDTGATVTALSPDDAERIGFDLSTLSFDRPVDTANGRTYVARVRLDNIEIGPITLTDVGATVHRDGLDQSLLGMNILDRLSGFERTGDRLILKP